LSKRLAAVMAAFLSGCDFNPVQQANFTPRVVLFEGNDATQDELCTLDIPSDQTNGFVYRFTTNPRCKNDEARSLVLYYVPTGLRVLVYDDGDCMTSDSATEIVVQRYIERKPIGTFEAELIDNDVHISLLHRGNLDGKVSCVIIRHSP
jgi:hypothetical protein